jgi:8-oxo-dGTP pyrophosphatase MutT (NUDIX family)
MQDGGAANGPVPRRSARVILLDPAGRVLLLRFRLTRGGRPFEFWATPGGGVEPGEGDHEAALRELDEELGLTVPLTGPVHYFESTFEVDGRHWFGQDVFFSASCASDAPRFIGGTEPEEREALQEMRWWTVPALEKTADSVYPPDLARVVRRLTS